LGHVQAFQLARQSSPKAVAQRNPFGRCKTYPFCDAASTRLYHALAVEVA
jgi:hypothetical protein